MIPLIQSEPSLLLELLSKDLLQSGIYGRITNIKTVKTIALVCKQWQAWIYNPNGGPFSLLGKDVEAIKNSKFPCGPINKLNQLMTAKGRAWFVFVDNYMRNPISPLPQNNIGINYVNENDMTPLQYAIDNALQDKKNLPLISILMEHDADPFMPVPMVHSTKPQRRYNHFAYVFDDRDFPDTLKFRLEAQIEVAQRLGDGLIHGDQKGENLFHYIDLFGNSKRKSFYAWYSKQGVNINQLSKQNLTPLHKAVQREHHRPCYDADATVDLIEAGASVNMPTPQGDFPIHIIIKEPCADFSFLETILNKDPSQAYLKDAQGYTPLWWAIKKGKTQFQEKLISLMDRDSLENKECYLLAIADYLRTEFFDDWGYRNTCSERNNRNSISRPNYSPLKCTQWTKQDYKPLIERLDLLLNLLANTEEEKTRLLTKILDANGNTFYHYLVNSHFPIFKLIYSRSSSPLSILELKNSKGETVRDILNLQFNTVKLIEACQNGNASIVTKLLEKPIHLFVTDKCSNTLLHLVVSRALNQQKTRDQIREYYEILQLLLDHGINPNACNSDGDSPLYHACLTRNISDNPFKLLLLDSGALPGLTKDTGADTPLDYIKWRRQSYNSLLAAFEGAENT